MPNEILREHGRHGTAQALLLRVSLFFFILNMFVFSAGDGAWAASGAGPFAGQDVSQAGEAEIGGESLVSDPLEPFNRAMFTFNDRLYFWAMKPVAKGYNRIVPEKGRKAVKRFFTNLASPVRFANSLLQFKIKAAGVELSRFVINTTVGVAGFMDPAGELGLKYSDKDLGQTLGRYGLGPGIFITWPFLGPSSARDTLGFVGDIFLDPATYLLGSHPEVLIASEGYKRINETSLEIGQYETVKQEAFDPYIFVRDAYIQQREALIQGEEEASPESPVDEGAAGEREESDGANTGSR